MPLRVEPSNSSVGGGGAAGGSKPWTCDRCTFGGNPPTLLACCMCATQRPVAAPSRAVVPAARIDRDGAPRSQPQYHTIDDDDDDGSPTLMRDGSMCLRAPSSESAMNRQGSSNAVFQPQRLSAMTAAEAIEAEALRKVREIAELCRVGGAPFFDPMDEYKDYEWAGTVGADKMIKPAPPQKEFVVFPPEGPTPESIVQQQLGNCWFLSVVAVVAHVHPELIESLFITKDINREGIFALKFWRDGVWTPVITDAYFPSVSGKYFRFGRCRCNTALWVPLLEKAYAKLHGGYKVLKGGRCADAFYDLTGMPCVSINNRGQSRDETWDEDEVFALLLSYTSAECTMAATCGGDTRTTAAAESLKLTPHHAYSLLMVAVDPITGQRVALMRNPWGRSDYGGVSVAVPIGDAASPSADGGVNGLPRGMFWIPFAAFTSCFSSVEVCLTRTYSSSLVIPNVAIDSAAGGKRGATMMPSVGEVQKRMCFTVSATCEVFVMAVQEDLRRNPGRLHFDVLLLLVRLDRANPASSKGGYRTLPTVVAHSLCDCERVKVLQKMLEPGTYCVLPVSMNADRPININILCEQPTLQLVRGPPTAFATMSQNDLPLNELLRNMLVDSRSAKRQAHFDSKGFITRSLNIGQGGSIMVVENRHTTAVESTIKFTEAVGLCANDAALLSREGKTFTLPPQTGIVAFLIVPMPHDGAYSIRQAHSIQMREVRHGEAKGALGPCIDQMFAI